MDVPASRSLASQTISGSVDGEDLRPAPPDPQPGDDVDRQEVDSPKVAVTQADRDDLAESTPLATVIGLGTAVPEHRISQVDAAQLAVHIGISSRYEKSLPVLYRQSGVDQRHSVLLQRASEVQQPAQRQSFYPLARGNGERGPTTAERMQAYNRYAPQLAAEASRAALTTAGIAPGDATHLVTVSCSGFGAPGVDLALIQELGLTAAIQRTHIGFMGCHGALNGMRVAKAICESQPAATVLLCAVELCSLHQQYSDDAQQLVANSLFADGAAALILQSRTRPNRDWGATDPRSRDSLNAACSPWHRQITILASASTIISDSQGMMSWEIGNHGFEMSLSPKVPELIRHQLPAWLDGWLATMSLNRSDISGWMIHPGGPRIVDACGECLCLSESDLAPSLSVLREFGNMSSPTVLFVLRSLLRKSDCAGYHLMLAFGPGLCVEAALLHIE